MRGWAHNVMNLIDINSDWFSLFLRRSKYDLISKIREQICRFQKLLSSELKCGLDSAIYPQ